MTRPKRNDEVINVTKQELLRVLGEDDALKQLMQTLLQEVLEAEMDEALQAGKGERTSGRLGYRSGHYPRTLVTRVGKLELRVPQDRQGRFSSELFARYQRSEKALVAALMEMYVQGVSTRRVKAITEELCGHEFSASAVSEINKKLDAELTRFMTRRLEEEYPYVIVDARYERVREEGVGHSRAVLITLGIGWDGRRHVLAVELANRESATSWKDHLLGLKTRGLHGVAFVVSDDHPGLKRAIRARLAADAPSPARAALPQSSGSRPEPTSIDVRNTNIPPAGRRSRRRNRRVTTSGKKKAAVARTAARKGFNDPRGG